MAAPLFAAKCGDSSFASMEVGNCYTGAVFLNLLSLVCRLSPAELAGKRVGMFSYGSGSMATLYSFTAREPSCELPAALKQPGQSGSQAGRQAGRQASIALSRQCDGTD